MTLDPCTLAEARGPWTVPQVVEAARRATISSHGCAGPISYITTTDLTVVTDSEPTT